MKESKPDAKIALKPPPLPGSHRPIDKVMIHSTMFDCGIIPMENPSFDMRRGLNQLPPEEATKMKRKFRKLWRALAREEKQKRHNKNVVDSLYGIGSLLTGESQKLERKKLVYETIWNKLIAPKLFVFENPENLNKNNDDTE